MADEPWDLGDCSRCDRRCLHPARCWNSDTPLIYILIFGGLAAGITAAFPFPTPHIPVPTLPPRRIF
jgi:hypothetical protein